MDLRLSSPLKYFSMNVRSLEAATTLVVIVMLFHNSLMQLMLMLDLYDLRRPLIWLVWVLVLFRIFPLSVVFMEMRMFFLEGPLVMICILGFPCFTPSLTLFILMILLVGSVGKASRSLRRFSGLPFVTCAKNLLVSLVLSSTFPFFLSLWAFLRASGLSWGGGDQGRELGHLGTSIV